MHLRESAYNIVHGPVHMARPEGLKSEAGRAERVGSCGEDVLLLTGGALLYAPSAGFGAKHRRPSDLERFVGLQNRSWCRSC